MAERLITPDQTEVSPAKQNIGSNTVRGRIFLKVSFLGVADR